MIRSLAIAAVGAVAIGAGGFALGGGFDDPLTPEYANWQHTICSAPPGGGKSRCYPTPPPESGWVLDSNQLINPRLSPNQRRATPACSSASTGSSHAASIGSWASPASRAPSPAEMSEPTRGAAPRALVQFRVGDALSPELARRVESRSASRVVKRAVTLYYELIGHEAVRLDFSACEIEAMREVVSRHDGDLSPRLLPALLEAAARPRPLSPPARPLFTAAPGEPRVLLPLGRAAAKARRLDPVGLHALMDRIEFG